MDNGCLPVLQAKSAVLKVDCDETELRMGEHFKAGTSEMIAALEQTCNDP